MKIFKNVLPKELLDTCRDEINRYTQQQVWGVGDLNWSAPIRNGVQRSAIARVLDKQETIAAIETAIKPFLPSYSNLIVQYYLWLDGSAISAHDDQHAKFGSTIYLNEEFDIDDGGLFVWRDRKSNEWKLHLPECNSMVVNDECEWHLVTPVAYRNKPRATIQIWGDMKRATE